MYHCLQFTDAQCFSLISTMCSQASRILLADQLQFFNLYYILLERYYLGLLTETIKQLERSNKVALYWINYKPTFPTIIQVVESPLLLCIKWIVDYSRKNSLTCNIHLTPTFPIISFTILSVITFMSNRQLYTNINEWSSIKEIF